MVRHQSTADSSVHGMGTHGQGRPVAGFCITIELVRGGRQSCLSMAMPVYIAASAIATACVMVKVPKIPDVFANLFVSFEII